MSATFHDQRGASGPAGPPEPGELQGAHEGAADGIADVMRDVFYQVTLGRDAPLLDEVFCAFKTTNQHQRRHFTLADILNITDERFFTFQHSALTYLATVYRNHGPDYEAVVLKLPNNGFEYLMAVAGRQLFRHQQRGWVELPGPQALARFPQLQEFVRPRYSHALIYYNLGAQRIDMKFKPKVEGEPVFMVTFEPGLPYDDEETAWCPI
ncbi:hypothetical protein PLESTB_001688900 [Pleodorina starrii]|uniref:Uncharacterized protein n=1 Tax=Pleodorina starrii TaxID=330485 RepID=A0A9W6F950_9CHLO|nr:hypothetical protein PLESTM_001661800 [Pleodorina starrii]GLC60898.1 hypothetical protein PLESTB_001688900 [Pleodorina starrii]GLC66652.1 hypothetical protein PLESTF_000457000 [Pleodorina starrii]